MNVDLSNEEIELLLKCITLAMISGFPATENKMVNDLDNLYDKLAQEVT